MFTKHNQYLFLATFTIVALSLGYSFLFLPLQNKHCVRLANKIEGERIIASVKAEEIYQERKTAGLYKDVLCSDNRYEGFFDDVDNGKPVESSSVPQSCKTEWGIVREIANEIYPYRGERAEIIAECKNRF